MSRLGLMALCCVCSVMLVPRVGEAQSLRFFKNYIVTGDYAVASVSLRGTGGAGVIDMTGANVPPNADIIAAFLYWQTVLTQTDAVDVGTAGATFKGHSLSVVRDDVTYSLAKALNPAGTAACSVSGSSAGGPYGIRRMVTYRADVLRFLEQNPTTGKLQVNTLHEVTLPDAGGDTSHTPSTSGASLVVVYRDPTMPLGATVIYDGGFTVDNRTPTMNLAMSGYYEPAASPAARLTLVAADGQPNFNEKVFVNNVAYPTPNPFDGPAWEDVTFDVDPLTLGTGGTANVRVAGAGTAFDCVSPAVAILGMRVKDTDEDGLIDIWESSATPLPDPAGGTLPNLRAMGADPFVQDIFVEVGYMATGGYTNSEQTVPAHSHLPSRTVFDMVATVFRNAGPRRSLSGGTIEGPINIHFDVGTQYQSTLPTAAQCQASWQPACAIVRVSAGARGGEQIAETVGCTESSGNTTCGGLFPNYPGTVGWKSGFNLLKNQPLNYTLVDGGPTLEQQCQADANCRRRFDQNRRHIFRYALFAHALGLIREDAAGNPILDSTNAYIPKNTSGIADGGGVGGGDLMVTLGLWDGFTGSAFIQASTLLHELGHGLGLRHGGGAPVQLTSGTFVGQPNCKPNYQSVMNYMFQISGLTDASGVPRLDLSRQTLSGLNEGSLVENLALQTGWNARPYRTTWYVPLANLSGIVGTATRHCDGSFITTGESFVRVSNDDLTGRLDWNMNGVTGDSGFAQDINFNSAINDGVGDYLAFVGHNDFERMDLRQTGSRRNAGSERIDGGLSVDVGFGDVGFGDVGFGDVGFGDVGFGDVGFGDVGFGDVGFGDVGFGDVGFGDVGFGDVGIGDDGTPQGEIDFDAASAPELNAPNSLAAVNQGKVVLLTWAAPHVGTVTGYNVYRAVGSSITTGSTIIRLGTTIPTTTATRFNDQTAQAGVTYTYFVVGQLSSGSLTGLSNFVTITK